MSKVEQLNSIIKHGLAEVIIGEVATPNFLITISRVECSSDLSLAKVFVSVLPDNFSGTALKRLRSSSGILAKLLKDKTKIIKVPHLSWGIDENLKRAEKINETLEIIRSEES